MQTSIKSYKIFRFLVTVILLIVFINACKFTNKKKDENLSKEPMPTGISNDMPDSASYEKLKLTEEYAKNIAKDTIRGTGTKASVEQFNGVPMLHINGNPVNSILMIPSFFAKGGNNEDIFNVCQDFAAAGINLYGELISCYENSFLYGWWLEEGRYNFSIIDKRMQTIIKANPNALILLRIVLDPPKNWIKKHREELSYIIKDGELLTSGNNIGSEEGVSLASELWEKTYEQMLRDVVRHIEASSYADHVFGYMLVGGRYGEWYWFGQREGDIDYSPAARTRFRKWLKEKYKNNKALQLAWNRKNVTFNSVEFPSPEKRRETECLTFRDPVRAKEYLDARQFLIDMTTQNVIKSCSIIKEETNGNKLAGTYYGYSMLRAGMASQFDLANNGQHDLNRIIDSHMVDFVSTPLDYRNRRGGQPGNLIGGAYISSIHLHNKMFFDEEDIRTYLYSGAAISYGANTLEETLSVMQRGAGWSIVKGNSMWWCPLAGNQTFHQEDIMNTVSAMKQISDKALNIDRSANAEVALFADEVSLNYIAYKDYKWESSEFEETLVSRDYFAHAAHPAVAGCMWRAYENATYMGAPFDLYLLQDIANKKLPDYKVYIFLNTYYTTPALRNAINEKVKRNNAVAVWLYAPGFITDEGFSEETMHELTGITIRHEIKQVKSVMDLTNISHPIIAPARVYGSSLPEEFNIEMGPRFWVEDPEAITLGECEGRPALVVKEKKGWRSVYSAFPLTKELLQGICDYAGVHVYSRGYDVFFANHSYAMLHAGSSGKRTIYFPGNYKVNELITGKDYGKITKLETTVSKMDTRIFRMEPTGR